MKKLYEVAVALLLTVILFALLIFSGCNSYPKGYSTPEIENYEEIRDLVNRPIGYPLTDSIRTIHMDKNGNVFINGSNPIENGTRIRN